MSIPIPFSPITEKHETAKLPERWLECSRKSTLIADKFIAFKTPLDDRYRTDIPIDKLWTCKMLIKYIKDDQKNLGLVIDLTKTNRYYRSDIEFKQKNIRYEKIPCDGHIGPPTRGQIKLFIQICREFINQNPHDIIGIHCTHGFNRTGFLICTFLCQEFKYSIDNAIHMFKTARPDGIYKQDYLNELNRQYGSNTSTTWSSSNKRSYNYEQSNKRIRKEYSTPKFAVDLPHIIPIQCESLLNNIRTQCQQMCNWNRQSFPGSQPISMDYTNYHTIFQSPYMISWKADGTRYMMLIKDINEIYMIDRDNNVFQIDNLYFPNEFNYKKYLTNTLVDGEFVIDKDKDKIKYRYLIYDIIIYENENVSQKIFTERLKIIEEKIVTVRDKADSLGFIKKTSEPFSIRNKQFWELSTISKLLSSEFQSQITHGCDGLVFQPILDAYQSGRCDRVLKWKEDNTIDFRLKIIQDNETEKKIGLLFVNNKSDAYDSMPYSSELDQYDNQIIECSYDNKEWKFYRHRSDKSYPNAQITADRIMQAIRHPLTKATLCSYVEEHIAFNNYFNEPVK